MLEMTLLSSGQTKILVNGITRNGDAASEERIRATISLVRPKYFEMLHQLRLLMNTRHASAIDNNFQTLRDMFAAKPNFTATPEDVLVQKLAPDGESEFP